MTYLTQAADDPQIIEECARHHKLPLPASLGANGLLVRAKLEGGPIEMTLKVRDFINPTTTTKSKYGGNNLAFWDLHAVEISTMFDITTMAGHRRFEPPANPHNMEGGRTWWRAALLGLSELLHSVQMVQYAKAAERTVDNWEQLPLIIWAKPFDVHQAAERAMPAGHSGMGVAAGSGTGQGSRGRAVGNGRASANPAKWAAGTGMAWADQGRAKRAVGSGTKVAANSGTEAAAKATWAPTWATWDPTQAAWAPTDAAWPPTEAAWVQWGADSGAASGTQVWDPTLAAWAPTDAPWPVAYSGFYY